MSDQQTILIAGGTGNVGGGAAVSLAKRGAHVVILGRNPDTLNPGRNTFWLRSIKMTAIHPERKLTPW